jgi:chromate reductase, NAD(P)H dehydrogenase (quinone)
LVKEAHVNDTLSILGIAGSLRKQSYNRAALRAAQSLVPKGAKLEIFDLAGIPPYNQDEEAQPPQPVVELKTRIRDADAILLVTPEYNYSIPGVLKNAIDWASRPYGESAWRGKPVAVMGASIGALGSARAQYHLRQCFVFLDAKLLNRPEVMIASCAQKFGPDGTLTDEATKGFIADQLKALAAWAKRINATRTSG